MRDSFKKIGVLPDKYLPPFATLLFSLHVLFSHFRPRDSTLENYECLPREKKIM